MTLKPYDFGALTTRLAAIQAAATQSPGDARPPLPARPPVRTKLGGAA